MRSIEYFISLLTMGLKNKFTIFFIIFLNFIYSSKSKSNDCICTEKSHEEHYCDSDFAMKVFVQSVEDKEVNDKSYSVQVTKIFEKNDVKNDVKNDGENDEENDGENDGKNDGKNKVNDQQNFHSNENEYDLKNQSFEMKTLEKMTEKSNSSNLNNNTIITHIYTLKDTSDCGRRLKVGKTYVITGWIDGNKARTTSCHYAKEPQEMTLKETFFFLLDYKNKNCSNERDHHNHHHSQQHHHHHHPHNPRHQSTTAATTEEECDEDGADGADKKRDFFPNKPELSAKPFVCPTEDISRGCKGSTDCLYPNPKSCNTFIHCIPNPDGSGTPVVKTCQSGHEWNNMKKVCDWPQFSTCLKKGY